MASDASEAPPTRFATGSSDLVFDPTVLHTFELTLTEENLARIDSDPGAEEWVEGSLTFDGERVDGVGIRYKGSVGAFVGCVANPDFSIPRGEKTCTKLSMKVKFDRVDPDQTFYGLRRLQFHLIFFIFLLLSFLVFLLLLAFVFRAFLFVFLFYLRTCVSLSLLPSLNFFLDYHIL